MTSKITKIEKYKRAVNLQDYYAKLTTLEQNSLTDADRFYLKNFGIYNSVLKPEHFMLRVRVPAGRIALSQLEAILAISQKFNAKLTLTARSQIEIQSLTLQSAIVAHKELAELGITTFATLTDNIRNIVTNPLDGVAKDAVIECYDIIKQMQEEFIQIDKLGALPRKFNSAISGNLSNIEPFYANDCFFVLAKKDNIYGFSLFVGGKNTNFATKLDIFVTKDEVASLYKALLELYISKGNKSSRTKARLHYLLEELGVDGFRQKLQELYKKPLLSGAKTVESIVQKEEFYELKDGSYAYCYKSNFGEIDSKDLAKLIELAKEKRLEIRLGVDQNIYLIGLKSKQTPIQSSNSVYDYKVCVGLKYCGFSIYDTKDASSAIDFGRLNALKLKVAFSGCLKGCARHISADIGFVGIRTNLYGTKEFAVRLYMGATYDSSLAPARLIYWAVPLRWLNRLIDAILDEFEDSKYSTFSTFSKEVLAKFSNEYLALHFLQRLDNQNPTLLTKAKEQKEPSELYTQIKELEKKIYS
jgi:ferredoxin-nitrite reductase